MIYTSRFSNPELKSGKYTVVGIVRGLPRFRLGYERAGNIIDIAPTKELFNVNDRSEFTMPYKKHLDDVGFSRIAAQIQRYVDLGKDVVLCCYEDVRIPDEWCHRQLFAEWWLSKTGEAIPELKDDSPTKIKPASKSKATAEIKFILSKDPSNRAYKVDNKGNEEKITFADALQLVAEGEAKIKDIKIEE